MQTTRSGFFTGWKLPEFLLVALFVVAPIYYHPNLGGEGLRIPNNSTIWMVALTLILVGIYRLVNQPTFMLPRGFSYILAFPLLVLVSSFVAGVEDPTAWLFRVLFIFGGLFFFIALCQSELSRKKIDQILYIIVIAAIFHSTVGIIQMYLKVDMPYLLPISKLGAPYGMLQQINNQVSFLVTVIAIAFYLVSRPLFFKPKQPLKFILLCVSAALAGYVIMVSGSRVGLLSILLALPIIIISRYQYLKKNKKHTIWLILSLVIGASSVWPVGSFTSTAFDKTTAIQSGYSGSARLGIYKVSLDLISEKPIFGHGIGGFSRVWQYEKVNFLKTHPEASFPKEMVSHPHNEIFQWAVEGGVLALAGLFVFIIGLLIVAYRLKSFRASTYIALMIPMGIHTMVELPFYMSAMHWFIFLFLTFNLYSHQLITKQKKLSAMATSTSKIMLLSSYLILMAFLIHTIASNWDFVSFYKGKQRENPLQIAKQNPYLYRDAIWIDMSAVLYSSMQYDMRENVIAYTQWGEKRLLTRPDVDLYIKLADAYEFLGDKINYCRIADSGLNMYPHAERLQRSDYICNL